MTPDPDTAKGSPANKSFSLAFSRAIGDRILIGTLCLMLDIFLVLLCYCFHQIDSAGIIGSVLAALAFEAFFTMAIFTLFALLWAVSAPHWLEQLMQGTARRLWLIVGILSAATVCTAVYFVCAGP